MGGVEVPQAEGVGLGRGIVGYPSLLGEGWTGGSSEGQ